MENSPRTQQPSRETATLSNREPCRSHAEYKYKHCRPAVLFAAPELIFPSRRFQSQHSLVPDWLPYGNLSSNVTLFPVSLTRFVVCKPKTFPKLCLKHLWSKWLLYNTSRYK